MRLIHQSKKCPHGTSLSKCQINPICQPGHIKCHLVHRKHSSPPLFPTFIYDCISFKILLESLHAWWLLPVGLSIGKSLIEHRYLCVLLVYWELRGQVIEPLRRNIEENDDLVNSNKKKVIGSSKPTSFCCPKSSKVDLLSWWQQ